LHTPVIYEKTTYGYRVVPNQDLRRFGNRSFYNEQGLRSEPMRPEVAPGALRVLCLGDSVTNGGAITDQAATFPYQLQALLRTHFNAVEVLNASAPGWALANELGWLRENGIFHSSLVVLTISTHDLFQEMAPSSTVGTHPSFPDKRPVLALQDAVHHYVLPRLSYAAEAADPGVAAVEASDARAAWNRDELYAIESLVRQQGGKLIVLLLEQTGENAPDTATAAAKKQLFAALAAQGVPALTLDAEISQIGRGALYRDDVHPNPIGNQVIAVALVRKVLELTMASAGAPAPAAAGKR
jgi:lysophospholipase L1-like esterase